MAVKKQSAYLNSKVDWLRKKADEMQKYVDDRPLDKLVDRIEWKPTAKGGMIPMVIQSIEGQVKLIKEIIKELPVILEAIDKLEEIEETKQKVAKGDQQLPARMTNR